MKESRFPLTRYFVWTSFLATAVISIALGTIMAQEVRDDLLDKAKGHAIRVIHHLQQDIRADFLEPLIASGEPIDLETNDVQYAQLDAIVQQLANSFGIRDLYIFDRQGLIVYSTRREHIGMMTPPSNELFERALRGEIASAVRYRGAPLDVVEGDHHPALLETYVPVRSIVEELDEGGPIANVIETYQDIEQFQSELADAQRRIVLATVIGAFLLFATLIWIVRHADRLILERTRELEHSNAQLTELSRGLEQEVERRTRQLIQSEKLAGLGTLAAGLAHEVNNPLATVSTCAQGLRSRLRDAEQGEPLDLKDAQEYTDLIIEESFRVKNITRSLLDFSRQSPGSKPEVFDIRQLLEETTGLLRVGPDLGDIAVDLPAESVSISGDSTTFRQLGFNVMKNAIDAIRERRESEPDLGAMIRWTIEENDSRVIVECHDNGVGFEPDQASQLVEPFHTTKDPGVGTGLGLALCHSMMRRFGGTIEIESAGPGRGATVRLTFPRS
ncbi:MAG: hypothetical protein KDC38_10110 [Planctomycetes bacterium]|nr:hypothetical protein [Planctomycetota bacterium]